MPLTVRLNHAIADGYLVAKVFKLLEEEISNFTANKTNKQKEVQSAYSVGKEVQKTVPPFYDFNLRKYIIGNYNKVMYKS